MNPGPFLSQVPRGTWTSNTERTGALLLLLVALSVRCALPEWIEFRGDERLALLSTREFLEQGQWLRGLQASTGMVMGPFLLYLLSPVVALTHDPVLVTGWVMLLNLGALAALFVLLRQGFGTRMAVLGTALFTSLVIGSIFARRLWAPDLLLPLTLPLYCLLVRLSREYARLWFLCATALFALACQIHPSAWFLAPGLFLACCLLRVRPPWRDLIWAAALVFLLYFPYLLYEWRTGFDDLHYLLQTRPAGVAHAHGFWQSLSEHWNADLRLTSAAALGEFLGPVRMELVRGSWLGAFASSTTPAVQLACGLASVWCIARVLRALAGRRHGRTMLAGERVLLVLACVLVTTSPAYVLLSVPPDLHYHVVLFPAVAVFLLVALADLLGPARAVWLTPAVSVLVLSQVVLAAEARRASFVAGGEGLFQPLSTEDLRTLRAHLSADLDQELARAARFEDTQRAFAERFERSAKTLWRLDLPQQGSLLVTGTGGVQVTPSSEGLVVQGSTPTDMLRLPEFRPASTGRSMLRLELSSPVPRPIVLFYSRFAQSELSRARVVESWIPSGRSTLHIELPDSKACGPLFVRLLAYRYVVYAAEVREVEP